MSKILIANIDWDATIEEQQENHLPRQIELEIPLTTDVVELDRLIGDKLCDIYGYCPKGFSYESQVDAFGQELINLIEAKVS